MGRPTGRGKGGGAAGAAPGDVGLVGGAHRAGARVVRPGQRGRQIRRAPRYGKEPVLTARGPVLTHFCRLPTFAKDLLFSPSKHSLESSTPLGDG